MGSGSCSPTTKNREVPSKNSSSPAAGAAVAYPQYGKPCPASASSEGGPSLRRSPCGEPARLRLTFLPESSARTPRPSAAPPASGGPRRCGGGDEAGGGGRGSGG